MLTSLIKQVEADPEETFHDFRAFSFSWTSFNGSEFTKRTSFFGAVFNSEAAFKGAVFMQGANFGRVTFNGAVDFRGSTLSQKNTFQGSLFRSDVSFQNATLQLVDFDSAVFERPASFNVTNFEGDVAFSKTVFKDLAGFNGSVFNDADKNADFNRATFMQAADFSGASFGGKSDFYGTTFQDVADFRLAKFEGLASFDEASFDKDAYFVGNVFHRCFRKECKFTLLRLNKEAEITFASVNLSGATFIHTNLEKVTFRDVDWFQVSPGLKVWAKRQQSLWDEFNFADGYRPNRSDYEKIGENYSQLVLKYEQRRDFNSAEDFHIGEMEMQRKKRGAEYSSTWVRSLWEWVNAYSIYRISSNYGTSYIQAFIVLIVLVLLFSLGFLFGGFRHSRDTASGQSQAIEYNLSSDAQHQPTEFRQVAEDYASAVSFSISIVTFQKDRFYEPMEGVSRFLLYLALFALTAQSALVLLAIRRRFKR